MRQDQQEIAASAQQPGDHADDLRRVVSEF
jgi:hypothetical protein